MSVEILDCETIINFLEDEEAFNGYVCSRFKDLDENCDGSLSYREMLKDLESLRVLEIHYGVDVKRTKEELANLYGSLFMKFDHDGNGTVDLEEYKEETKRMMQAMANALGFLPVQMLLEEDSFLKKAVEREMKVSKV